MQLAFQGKKNQNHRRMTAYMHFNSKVPPTSNLSNYHFQKNGRETFQNENEFPTSKNQNAS